MSIMALQTSDINIMMSMNQIMSMDQSMSMCSENMRRFIAAITPRLNI